MSASLVPTIEALAAADLHARARADADLASFLRVVAKDLCIGGTSATLAVRGLKELADDLEGRARRLGASAEGLTPKVLSGSPWDALVDQFVNNLDPVGLVALGRHVVRLLSTVRWQQDEDENTRVLWDVGRTHWFASITRVRPGCWSVMIQPREGSSEQFYVEPGGEHVARARALAWFEERGAPLVVLEEPCPT